MTPGEAPATTTSKSGTFSALERQTVTAQALPVLAGYFAKGIKLTSQRTIGTTNVDSLDQAAVFVRMRVLLAAAAELEPIIAQISKRLSFSYQRVNSESVGLIKGRLNTTEYVRRRHEVTAPRRFPIQEVRRNHDLPENVLVAAATILIIKELQSLPTALLPDNSSEAERIRLTIRSMHQTIAGPALEQARTSAHQAIEKERIDHLLDAVDRRIESRQIPNVDAYSALVQWLKNFDPASATPTAGELPWLFYDEDFDTRLFELWSLKHLLDQLQELLGPPITTRLLLERKSEPIATWHAAGNTIEVWFQAGLKKLDVGGTIWNYTVRPEPDEPSPKAKALTGIPDIVVVVQKSGEARQPVIIDPKLRQRDSIPSNELYKILGYFSNLPAEHTRRGVIIFHTPGNPHQYDLTDDGNGKLLATGVDPLDHERSAAAFQNLAEFVTSEIPPSALARSQGPADPDDPNQVESWVDTCQKESLMEMKAAIDEPSLSQSLKAMRSNLPNTWESLDEDTQRMLATAEHFGQIATAEMDHSGPILGLAASCERVLRSYVDRNKIIVDDRTTLGNLLHHFKEACNFASTPEGSQLREIFKRDAIDIDNMRKLVHELFNLNKTYRIPAAHAEVLEENAWMHGRATVLLGPDALLPRIVKTLQLPSTGHTLNPSHQ